MTRTVAGGRISASTALLPEVRAELRRLGLSDEELDRLPDQIVARMQSLHGSGWIEGLGGLKAFAEKFGHDWLTVLDAASRGTLADLMRG